MIRTLVICGDPWHPAATIELGLKALNGAAFAFEFLVNDAEWPAVRLNDFPLVVLARANLTSSEERPWLMPETQGVLADYVTQGGGLLVVHAGTARYENLPALNALIGGAFVRHPAPCNVTMEPLSSHPVVDGVASFTARDEHYFMAMNDSPADLFLQSRSLHGVQPAGWARASGRGRVCVLTPGHDREVWLHPMFQKLLFNALRWTARVN